MKRMLEAGAICPSQSPWCNTIVLVRKKDRGLHFCIDFWKLNVRTQKDSYPLPHIQEAIESLIRAGYFSCLDLKVGFLADCHGCNVETVYCLHSGELRIFECEQMPFGLCSAPATFQRLMQNCLGNLNLMYC